VTFPDGTYYACNDPETLTCTEPEEAIEEYLDGFLAPKMTAAEVLACVREVGVTVTAYKQAEIDDKQIEAWADSLLETLGENFGEENSAPDDGPCDAFPDDAEQVMRAAVKSIVSRAHVWRCEPSGKVDLSPDQIEEWVRENRPDWLVPAPTPEEKQP
jgi:hypothetical protein